MSNYIEQPPTAGQAVEDDATLEKPKRPPRAPEPRASAALVSEVLGKMDAYSKKPMIRHAGAGYIVAIQPKTNRAIAIVDGDFGRAEYKSVVADAEAADLATDAVIVVATTATYSGRGIHFNKFEDLGLFNPSTKREAPNYVAPPAAEQGALARSIAAFKLEKARAKQRGFEVLPSVDGPYVLNPVVDRVVGRKGSEEYRAATSNFVEPNQVYEALSDDTFWQSKVIHEGGRFNVVVYDADGGRCQEREKSFEDQGLAVAFADRAVLRTSDREVAANAITKLPYTYRDASNYKAHSAIYLVGRLEPQAIEAIEGKLDAGDGFIPFDLGLGIPELQGQLPSFPCDDDQVFHEFDFAEIEFIENVPDGESAIELTDFLSAFEKIADANAWDVDAAEQRLCIGDHLEAGEDDLSRPTP